MARAARLRDADVPADLDRLNRAGRCRVEV
jgi:hypothetical protein